MATYVANIQNKAVCYNSITAKCQVFIYGHIASSALSVTVSLCTCTYIHVCILYIYICILYIATYVYSCLVAHTI